MNSNQAEFEKRLGGTLEQLQDTLKLLDGEKFDGTVEHFMGDSKPRDPSRKVYRMKILEELKKEHDFLIDEVTKCISFSNEKRTENYSIKIKDYVAYNGFLLTDEKNNLRFQISDDESYKHLKPWIVECEE